MPKNNENFNKELEGFLRAQGIKKIATLDTNGEAVPDSKHADQFKFHYRNGEFDYGTVTVTTDDGKVTVYFNESVVRDPERGIDTNWTKFLMKLKDWSLRNGQMGFQVRNLDELGNQMRKRQIQKEEEKLLEGYYGTKHTSYNDNNPKIKMIIKHSKALDENDQRFRYIDKIFLENEVGERLLVPTKKPSVGRAFARHLAEGGEYNDDRWKHIYEISEDLNKLSGFVRATKSNQFNESVMQVVNEATEHYLKLKETLHKIQGSRGYHQYFESYKPSIMENDVENDYSNMFTTSRLDPRIEDAFPVLSKLNIRANELSEANEFEDWANSIVEGRSPELDKKIEDLLKILNNSEKVAVGADAMNIKGQLDDIIDDDSDKDQLYSELEKVAHADPDHDAKPVIVAWLQERSDDKFYGDVLDKMETSTPSMPKPEPEIATNPAKEKPSAPAQPMPGSEEIPEPSPQDAKAAQQFMPTPLAEKAKKPVQRNFVAKHAQRSGAGSHGKKGHQRHDKHKKQLGEEDVAEGYSELDNLKKKFEGTVERILQRAKEEGRGPDQFTDREKRAIAILKGKDQKVLEGIARGPKEKKLFELLNTWHYFISFKSMHIARTADSQEGARELSNMAKHYLGPVMNGMTFGEIMKSDLWQNPKVIPHLLKYIYQGIPYIEERIKKFVKSSDQSSYLSGVDNIKRLYKEVVAQYSQGVSEDLLNEEAGNMVIRRLIAEFNEQMSGSPYYPLDYKDVGTRSWTRGDGVRYKDPGYIYIDKNMHPQDIKKYSEQEPVEKFWDFLSSKGARKIGDVSGEFGSDPHNPAVVLGKLIFVFNGRNIAWGSTSRLKNSTVWRQKKQGVAEGGILKSIKRGLQGWDKNAIGPGGEKLGDPRGIVQRAKAMDTDTAKKVRAGLDAASDHSPAGLQKRVLDRKLKGVTEDQLDELKCWDGYKRVPGTTAGAPGSCEKVNEFAPSSGGGKDDVLKTLASNWYHGDVTSGDLTSDIQSQEQVERRLEKGVVCPDGVKRKLYIDYSDDYEGVTIYSDDDWSITYKQDDLSESKTNESLSAIKRLSGLK